MKRRLSSKPQAKAEYSGLDSLMPRMSRLAERSKIVPFSNSELPAPPISALLSPGSRSTPGPRPKTNLGSKLRQRDRGQFVNQPVHTQTLRLRQLPQPRVLLFRKPDRKCTHRRASNKCAGLTIRIPEKRNSARNKWR
jgi:hypothetical protein